jgi:hypothetical protein
LVVLCITRSAPSAVAAEVLGRAVHHEVGAERERLLQHRAGKGVVDRDQRAVIAGQRSEPGEVADPQQRVRRSLDPEQRGGLAQRLAHRGEIGRVDERRVDAEPWQHLAQLLGAAVVAVVRGDDAAARCGQREDRETRG